MAKANTTLDEELYAALQTARKGKPRNFCLIAKGPEVLKLIVQKKKITEGAMNKAKTEAKGNAVIQGVVVGSGADLAFEVLDAEPNIKPVKLRDFISEQTDITCKPRWAVVTALQEVPDEESLTETPPETGKKTSPPSDTGEKSTTPPETDFAARARESLVPREKSIQSGLEWAAKAKSPHEPQLVEAYEAAREKLAQAKTESDFDAAVQAHDDVIGLIRKAIQEAKGPAKAPVETAPVSSKDFSGQLAWAIEVLKDLMRNQFANQTELQRCAGLAKSADSHAKAGNAEQAGLVLKELQDALSTAREQANEALQQAMHEFRSHPDSKYIRKTISEIWAWRGFDADQKKAGLKAIAADREMAEAGANLEKATELRAIAKLACEAWDKEVLRVAQAAAALKKLYEPHRAVINQAVLLFKQKKGLPKAVSDILDEFKDPYNEFIDHWDHDRYEKATSGLDAVAKLAQKAVDSERSIREAKERFDNADKGIGGPFAEAKKFAQMLVTQKLNVGPAKKLCEDLFAAGDLVAKKIIAFEYDDAIPLLGGVQAATNAVLKFKGQYDQAKQTVDDEWNKISPDLDFARDMPDVSPTAIGDKEAMEDSYDRLNDAYSDLDYLTAANELVPLQNAVAKVKLALEQLNREQGEFQTDWNAVNDDYNAVKNLGARDKKVQPLVDALDKAYNELLVPFRAYDYVAAKAKIPALKLAIQPLLTERPKQEAEWNKALKKVSSIEKKWKAVVNVSDSLQQLSNDCNVIWNNAHQLAQEGNFLGGKARLVDFVKAYDIYAKAVAAHNKVAEPKAKEARKEVETLAKKGDLKKKTVAEKKDLLDKLRGTTEMGKDERKAQRLIYASLELDEDFLEEDKKKRKLVAGKLTDSHEKRAELRDFRSNWSKKSLEQKLGIVRKALEAQCEAMGFGDDPPEIVTYSDPGSKKLIENGHFNHDDGKIYLNTDPKASLSRDLDETLDLIFHENSHNYQDKLIKRLDPSSSNPLAPSDPEYPQALLFQLNVGPHSYVKGEEDFVDYKKQPLEEHAHDNGPKTAKAVLDKLKKKKKSK
jgi:hypothetical protein